MASEGTGGDMQQWWLEPGFLAFDTETTGIDPAHDRIVTAAVVHFRNGRPVEHHDWLLQCDIPIPPGSTAVHGVTDEMSRTQGIDQTDALLRIREALTHGNLPIVAFNADFDMNTLNANLVRLGLPALVDRRVICPMVIDRQFDRYVKGSGQRRLMPTAQRYGVSLHEDDWHGATPDAIAAGEIFLAQMRTHDSLRALDASTLAQHIRTWRHSQDEDFKAWLASRPERPVTHQQKPGLPVR